MYIILVIGIIVVSFVVSTWSRLKSVRERYSYFFNFILTLLATFIGVFFATDLTSRNEMQQEELKTIKLLDASSIDLFNSIRSTDILIEYRSILSDSTQQSPFALPLPDVFHQIAQHELILRNVSSKGIEQFSLSRSNLNNIENTLANTTSARTSNLKKYRQYLGYSREIVLLEKNRLLLKISDHSLEKKYISLIENLLKNEI